MAELKVRLKQKSWRRMTIAAILFLAMTGWGIYCIEKGMDIEWFKTYVMGATLLGFFAIGAIAATDVIDRWKK